MKNRNKYSKGIREPQNMPYTDEEIRKLVPKQEVDLYTQFLRKYLLTKYQKLQQEQITSP